MKGELAPGTLAIAVARSGSRRRNRVSAYAAMWAFMAIYAGVGIVFLVAWWRWFE